MISNVVLFIGTVFAFYLLLRMFCLWTFLFLLRIRVIVAPLGISVGAFFQSTMMTYSAASTEKSTDLFWFFNCCEITVTSIRLFLTFLWSGGADSNSLKTVCLTPMSSQETGVPKQVLVCLASWSLRNCSTFRVAPFAYFLTNISYQCSINSAFW